MHDDTILRYILVSVNTRANNLFFDSEPGRREAAPGPLALVQAFVNTVVADRGWDAIGDPGSLRLWLARKGLLPEGAQVEYTDVGRTRQVREALRSLLAANNGRGVKPEAVGALNRAAERARLSVRFDGDGGAVLEAGTGGVDGALGRVLAATHTAMAEGTWGRLKACANEECVWAFYDRSRNRSSRWCSMEVCGNRTKTKAYRRRKAHTS